MFKKYTALTSLLTLKSLKLEPVFFTAEPADSMYGWLGCLSWGWVARPQRCCRASPEDRAARVSGTCLGNVSWGVSLLSLLPWTPVTGRGRGWLGLSLEDFPHKKMLPTLPSQSHCSKMTLAEWRGSRGNDAYFPGHWIERAFQLLRPQSRSPGPWSSRYSHRPHFVVEEAEIQTGEVTVPTSYSQPRWPQSLFLQILLHCSQSEASWREREKRGRKRNDKRGYLEKEWKVKDRKEEGRQVGGGKEGLKQEGKTQCWRARKSLSELLAPIQPQNGFL